MAKWRLTYIFTTPYNNDPVDVRQVAEAMVTKEYGDTELIDMCSEIVIENLERLDG